MFSQRACERLVGWPHLRVVRSWPRRDEGCGCLFRWTPAVGKRLSRDKTHCIIYIVLLWNCTTRKEILICCRIVIVPHTECIAYLFSVYWSSTICITASQYHEIKAFELPSYESRKGIMMERGNVLKHVIPSTPSWVKNVIVRTKSQILFRSQDSSSWRRSQSGSADFERSSGFFFSG